MNATDEPPEHAEGHPTTGWPSTTPEGVSTGWENPSVPLLALDSAAGDAVVDATTVGAATWAAIWRQRTGDRLRCRSCGVAMHAKQRSATGMRFFAHATRVPDCPHLGESARHLELKARFADAFRQAGWVAELEAIGDGFRADVLASSGERRIAVEVQLAAMTADEATQRTARHAAASVETVWVVEGRRRSWTAALPTVAVTAEDEVAMTVLVPDGDGRVRFARPASISHFVQRLAAGAIRPFPHSTSPITGDDVGGCYQLGDCASSAHDAYTRRRELEASRAAARQRAFESRLLRIEAALAPKVEAMTASLEAFQGWIGNHRPDLNCWFTAERVADPAEAARIRPHGDAIILLGVSRPMWVFALAEPKQPMPARDPRVAAWTVTCVPLDRFERVYRPGSACDIEQGELKRYEPHRRRWR